MKFGRPLFRTIFPFFLPTAGLTGFKPIAILILLLSLLLTREGISQDRYLDSLRSVLDQGLSTDTEIEIMLMLGNAYLDEYPDSLSDLVGRLKPLVDRHEDPLLKAKSKYYEAAVLRHAGEVEAAIQLYSRANAIFLESGDSLFYMKGNRALGLAHYRKTRLDSAVMYFEESLNVARQIGSKYFQARNHRSLAITLLNQDQYFAAIDHSQEGIILAQEIQDTLLWADNLSTLANVHFYINEFGKMAEYTRQSLELMILIGSKPANFNEYLLSDYLNIAIALILDERIEEAGPYLKQGDSLKQLIGKPIPNFDNTYGHFYLKMGEEDLALFYLRKALAYGRQTNDAYVLAAVLNGMGELYFLQKKYDSAAIFLEENLGITSRTGQAFYYSEALMRLSEVEAARNNHRQAYDHFRAYHDLSDSLLNESKITEITTLKNRYAFEGEKRDLKRIQEEKDFVMQSQLAKKQLIQNGLIVGLILFFIVSVIIFRFYRSKQNDNLRIQQQSAELKKTNEEILELSTYKQGLTQMIAHDMKNPLNVIISLANNFRKKDDLEEIAQSGKLMLQMVHNMLDIQKFEETKMELKEADHSLAALVLEAKYQVELLLMAKSIEFVNEVVEEMTMYADYDIIKRVFVNLFTNAIKYTPIGGKLTIQAIEKKDRIEISVIDTGKGIPDDLQTHIFDKFWQSDPKKYGMTTSNGLGLTFCKMAVMAHGGKIQVASKEGEGATFYFDLKSGVAEKVKPGASLHGAITAPELTEQDQQVIRRIAGRLGQVPIYKSSKIEELLKELDSFDTPGIGMWKNKIREASYSFDNHAFEELINV